MYKYFCLNPISPVGLEKFSDDYVPAGEMAGADAVLVAVGRRAYTESLFGKELDLKVERGKILVNENSGG